MKQGVYFCGLFILLANIFARAENFDSTATAVGRTPNGLVTPVNQIVTPVGTQVELAGMRPNALALSPDGKILVTTGLTNELVVINPVGGKILQRIAFPTDIVAQDSAEASSENLSVQKKAQLSFTGIVFSPDGKKIYLADVNGDVKVFSVTNENLSPLCAFALPTANAHGRTNEIPAGIAVSADGKKIYVCGNMSNRLFEMDAADGKILRTWSVGVAPFDAVICKNKIYVSNWGGRRPDADSTTGPAGHGSLVRVDARGIASEGSISVIDLKSEIQIQKSKIVVGPHACALALSPNGKFLAVASAGSDMVSILDTSSDEVIETFTTRQNPADLFGAQPDALAFDASGKILYCANASQNAVAVFQFKPRETTLLGLIPAGWFPSSIQFDARTKTICVANLKDIADMMEKPRKGFGNGGAGFNTRQYNGSLSLIPVPSKIDLQKFTQAALANLRYPLLAQAKLPPRENEIAKPVPERAGEPSVFKHVIYIIKENRTYDQIFGDVKEGNGNPDLCAFGENVTPNEHKLVRDFCLLDNTYCCSILSADGHNWTDSGIATEYLEREFAGWPRSYPSGGDGEAAKDALAYSPAGFIWNDALAHGKTVVDFGEFATSISGWKDKSQHKNKPRFFDYYNQFASGTDELEIGCEPDIAAIRSFLVSDTVGWNLDIPDQWRAKIFCEKLKQFEADGNLPNLTILWLPNDHTSGTKINSPTPRAQVADNDLALGKIVEAVSRSKFWKDTCIFAIEDDPQNGWDHVSGYRTTAYVVSPYTKRGAVVSTQFNTTSLLRTMELMLGLPPMNQFDATATPMFDCFTNTPDFSAFNSVTNNVPLDEMNKPVKKTESAQIQKDILVSNKLPLEKPDQCDENTLNRILWRATMGAKPYPEWAVKTVVDDD